jgi:hypothetical protein
VPSEECVYRVSGEVVVTFGQSALGPVRPSQVLDLQTSIRRSGWGGGRRCVLSTHVERAVGDHGALKGVLPIGLLVDHKGLHTEAAHRALPSASSALTFVPLLA